jgi:hypothetical protein
MYSSVSQNPFDRLSSLIFISGIFLFLIATFLMVSDTAYSQANTSNSTLQPIQLRNIPESLNKSYSIPAMSFHITFPGGWKGLNYQNIAMVSPAGVHLMNGNLGPNRDQVLMVIETLNVSDFQEQRKQFSEIEKNGCNILSDRYVKINSIKSHELFWQCSSDNDDTMDKIINYFIASENKIIVVGLKGSGSAFDNNLEKFMNSVRTLSISHPIDISKIG